MKKSDGILSLKKAAKLLNKHAPEGESLAYINPEEARLLKSHGGSGIMTVANVPSYWSWKDVGKKILEYGPKVMEVVNWFKGPKDPSNQLVDQSTQINQPVGRSYDQNDPLGPAQQYQYKTPSTPWSDIVTGAQKWATERYSNPANIMRDVATIGTVGYGIYEDFKKGKIDKENFERQMAEEAANRAEIQANLGQFSVGDIPQEEEIARFTEATGRPDMETNPWAAEGGRIGAFNGGIQGLMPQQGFMPQPGLDPRMGYALGGPQEQISETENFNWGGPDVVETANIREKALFNNPIFDRDVQALEKEQTGKFDEIVRQDLMERVMKYIRDAGGSYKVPERSYWEALSKAIEAGDEDVIEYLSQSLYGYPKRVAKQEMPMGAAQGGRIGAQEGGLMNLGGMEKDYRQEGGFVPIGGQEKADDVPARLSKNEFVFTADAVRAAGGGDIDAGAEVMENVMENLEQGGQVSEESQGLEGARNMFATAQRLGGVI